MPKIDVNIELRRNIRDIIDKKGYPPEIYDDLIVIVTTLREDGRISVNDLNEIVNRIGKTILDHNGVD